MSGPKTGKPFLGGEKLRAHLEGMARQLVAPKVLRVGFLAEATYPDGQSVPAIAAIQEFGGTITIPEHDITIYRKLNADGDFARGGKFVRKKSSNFATTHKVRQHTITIPPRPFFRLAIAKYSGEWAEQFVRKFKRNGYDAADALASLGMVIAGQIQQSIQDLTEPPLAPSTILRKGFDKPLIDTSTMWKSVSAEIK